MSTPPRAQVGSAPLGATSVGVDRSIRSTPTHAYATVAERQLRAAGWTLLSVPYWEWDALEVPGNAEEQRLRRREYLTRKLTLVS